MENADKYLTMVKELLLNYAPKFIMAIVVLFIGLWAIKMLMKVFNKVMNRGSVEQSLKTFLTSLFSIILKVLLIVSVASMVGIEMTSFVAILAAAGFAVGMALSGSLQNFAGGVMILLFKPFKVGDFIEAQGHLGVVSEIHIFNTILKTPDNKTIIQPNGSLSTGSVTNYSTEPLRRVDMSFGISYSDNIDHAKDTIFKIINTDSRILKDPSPFVAVSSLGDSSVNFAVRVWVNTPDYWGVFFDMQEQVKKTFDKEKISIPFPQTDVHLHKPG